MKIDTISLKNFRAFEERNVDLAPGFNLLIGDNATGKTSILDALAVGLGSLFLGFPDPGKARSIHRDEVRLAMFQQGREWTREPQFPSQITCRGFVDGTSTLWTRRLRNLDGRTDRQDASEIRRRAEKLHQRVQHGAEGQVLPVISYYGTGRLWVQIRDREVQTLKPDTRFMGYLDCLNPASDQKRLVSWFKTQELVALQRQEAVPTLEACRKAILTCIPAATHVWFDVARDDLMLQTPDGEMPFGHLSDGYRNMVAMAADIAVRCATLNPALGADAAAGTPGVVLIDEIDLHLHPKWQRHVVTDLMRAFPLVQFVATTHSPFIIQSLPRTPGVRLINLDNEGATIRDNQSIEDITEEVQGVDLPQMSQRKLDMLRTAEEYYRLLEQVPEAAADEREALSQRLNELLLPFSDDPAYHGFLRVQRQASGLDGRRE